MSATTSVGTQLMVAVATVQTAVAGLRTVKFTAPSPETFECDDLDDDFVNKDVTDRTSGGGFSATLFFDPASATHATLIDLINNPAREDFELAYSDTGSTVQALNGILTKMENSADRGEPLMQDIEVETARKPTVA